MAKKLMYPVDAQKMRDALTQRGLMFTEVSNAIGYESGYISGVLNEKKIAKAAAMLLERIYNIQPEDYKPETEESVTPEVEPAPAPVQPSFDMADLRETVTQSIVDAALILLQNKHVRAEFQQMLYASIKGALAKIASERK